MQRYGKVDKECGDVFIISMNGILRIEDKFVLCDEFVYVDRNIRDEVFLEFLREYFCFMRDQGVLFLRRFSDGVLLKFFFREWDDEFFLLLRIDEGRFLERDDFLIFLRKVWDDFK